MANATNNRSLDSRKSWDNMVSPDTKPGNGNDKKTGDDTTKDPQPKV